MDGLREGGEGLFLAQQTGEERRTSAGTESKQAAAEDGQDSGLGVPELSWMLVDAEDSWAICMIRVKTPFAAGN